MESEREMAMESGRGFEGGETEPSNELNRAGSTLWARECLGLGEGEEGGETEPSNELNRAGLTLWVRECMGTNLWSCWWRYLGRCSISHGLPGTTLYLGAAAAAAARQAERQRETERNRERERG